MHSVLHHFLSHLAALLGVVRTFVKRSSHSPMRCCLLFVLALAGVAAAGKESVTTYTAEAKQKELKQLRDAQTKAEAEAKADCSSYPLANPILDCEKESACYRADVKWGAMEKSFLSSAKAQWKQILATVEANTKSNETLAHYSADLRHVADHLAKLRQARPRRRKGRLNRLCQPERVKYKRRSQSGISPQELRRAHGQG